MARPNQALICKGNARTIIREVVNRTASVFSIAAVQLNKNVLNLFGKCVESAFGSVCQKCLVTISPGGVIPEAKVFWTEAPSDDAVPSGPDDK